MSFETEVKDAGGVRIHGQMMVDGMRINNFGKPPEVTASIIRNIKQLKIRDDDIMLCTPVKSGTKKPRSQHCGRPAQYHISRQSGQRNRAAEKTPEICPISNKPDIRTGTCVCIRPTIGPRSRTLFATLQRYPLGIRNTEHDKAEISPIHKSFWMLANCPESDMDTFASPRILNTHCPFHMLPTQLKEKKTKIIVVLRNPKDVAVSLYYHHKGMRMFQYEGNFLDHLQLFKSGSLEYNSWFDYVREIENAEAAEPDRIRIFYYEDLKENGAAEIQNMAAFLNLPAANDEKLCMEINDMCHIKRLKIDKALEPELRKIMLKDDFSFFRKGEIGDWKNHFTEEENEKFDKLFAEKMKGSKLKFRFEAANANK